MRLPAALLFVLPVFAQLTASDFCPEHITLAAYGATTCYIASGIVKGAAPMTALIDIAGIDVPGVQ